ncbi:hypothetical protein [Saccharothrix syringae]|nr:hypothetical protein [Saccharothrix syringae]
MATRTPTPGSAVLPTARPVIGPAAEPVIGPAAVPVVPVPPGRAGGRP